MSDSESSSRKNLAKGGAIGFVGAAVSAILGFFFTVVLARMLGAEGSGVVTQATGVFAVVMALAKVGLDSTAIYLLPRLRVDSAEEIRGCLNFMAAMAVGVSLVAVLVLQALAPVIWQGADSQVRGAIQAVLWFVPIGSLTLVATAALRALGNMRQYVLVQNITLPGLRPILVAATATVGGSLSLVAVSWALPFVVILVAAWVLVLRHLPDIVAAPRWPQASRRHQIVGFALPRTLTAGLEQALTWLDVLLVGLLAGNAAAGIYGGAARFIQAGLIVDTALRVVVSPQFSRLLHMSKIEELRRLYSTATIWLILFATPIHILMAIYAPALMKILGDQFVSGSWVLAILCCGAMVTFLAGNIHSLLIMSGRSGWAAINKVVVLTVNVVGNLAFIPLYGLNAAAVVWAVCMVLDAVMATIQVAKFIGVRPSAGETLIPLIGVFVSVGIPAFGVSMLLGRGTYSGLIWGIFASIAGFATMCWILRSALQLNGLGSLVRQKRG
ncbi:polysaccharide biosynthesis C-terminal domain-containing protein [Schaalia vaccimaxillae]|uniref:oligosaccharide flippase family protein n=1 Tax=Schaalia vaccimaxillae TaxID=183916 RepID=UPI0003B716F7|nr:polysaccharide biosynthesis C-terminal domain-containing protein [Schaalia vaccimaxillae]